MNRLLIKKWKK